MRAVFWMKEKDTMHIHVDAQTFCQALKQVKPGLGSPSTDPFVVIRAEGETVKVVSWERMRMTVSIAGTIDRAGACAVSHEALFTLIRAQDGLITLKQEGTDVIVSSGDQARRCTATIAGKEPEKVQPPSQQSQVGTVYTTKKTVQNTCETCKRPLFPPESVEETYEVVKEETQQVMLPRAQLLKLLSYVNWLSEWEYGKPYLGGICLEMDEQRLSLIGADRCCLAIATAIATGAWPRRVLVHSETLTKAVRALPKSDVSLEAMRALHRLIKRNDEPVHDAEPFERPISLTLTALDMKITLPLMDEKIPAYRTLIPAAVQTTAACATKETLSALQALAPLASRFGCRTNLCISASMLSFSVTPAKAKEPLACYELPIAARTGPDVRVLVNETYLISALEQVRAPQIALEFGEPDRPMILRTCGDEDYTLVVQTMKRPA